MLHSIYDLTTFCRKTTGDVPPKLVGASTTVVGSKMYLFGGRLVSERRMVADLYIFDLDSFQWERIYVHPEDDVPQPRYFHSADTWSNQLIIFGGMSNQPDSPNPDDLCVLNDVRIFDIATRHWLPATPAASDVLVPRARYAHLSSVTSNRLFIIGGQDFNNTWLDDICIYDLLTRAWVQRRDYPRHCGTYRSVAVSALTTVRLPHEERRRAPPSPFLHYTPGPRFSLDHPLMAPLTEPTPAESLIHLPYSAPPTDDYPSDIYLYSNYNFTDVKRELEVFSPLPESGFAIHDKSTVMAGTTLPPGLRFPTGALLGTHLIIAGTYLAHSYQSFSIWVLDLLTMAWSRIDPGKAIESGSWFRGCLHPSVNKFIIFGNKHGNLVDDYNRRLLSWDHVAVVDLEAFGIYQPPPLLLEIPMQELGLSALEGGLFSDFEILCDDGRRIGCSRQVLEERWPWFAEEMKRFGAGARKAVEGLPASAMDVPMPVLPGARVRARGASETPTTNTAAAGTGDPRLTPRTFHLSEPYPITLALLQYLYTCTLATPLQHAPAVLSQLLVLATTYKLEHLSALVRHTMHRALSNSTSVGVYEVATLCGCRSLQIRALKTVMSYTQKRPTRSKGERDAGPGKPPGSGGTGGPPRVGSAGDGGSGPDSWHGSRPRGMSDAPFRGMMGGASNNGGEAGGSRYGNRTHQVPDPPDPHPSSQQDSPDDADEEEEKAKEDDNDTDEITPLPNLGAKPVRRQQRPVSLRAEREITALADFMSSMIADGPLRSPYDEDPTDPNPLFTTHRTLRASSPSPPSVQIKLPACLSSPQSPASPSLPRSFSESELHHQQHRARAEYPYQHRGRARPPRISTESIPGAPTPSLFSVSTGKVSSPGPATPSQSPQELPDVHQQFFQQQPHYSTMTQRQHALQPQTPLTPQNLALSYQPPQSPSTPQRKTERASFGKFSRDGSVGSYKCREVVHIHDAEPPPPDHPAAQNVGSTSGVVDSPYPYDSQDPFAAHSPLKAADGERPAHVAPKAQHAALSWDMPWMQMQNESSSGSGASGSSDEDHTYHRQDHAQGAAESTLHTPLRHQSFQTSARSAPSSPGSLGTIETTSNWDIQSQFSLASSRTTTTMATLLSQRSPPSFARFFKKEPLSEEQRLKLLKEKQEKRARKKEKREQMRLEKVQRELMVMPSMMGGVAF